jgi:hypothetical protein
VGDADLAAVNDAELIELYNAGHSELFPALRREGALTPLVVLLAVLPPLFALVNDGINSADARWGLESLTLVSSPTVETVVSRGGSLDAHPAWQQPLAAALTTLSLRIPGLSMPFALALVPFVCTIGVVLIWHAMCRDLAGPRFAIWSTALIACHGPFLVHVQSAAPALLILLLVLIAFWAFVSHVRSVDGVVSVQTLIGGVSLGLCLLVSGLAAIAAVAVCVLLAVALQMDAGKTDANGNGETRSQMRGRWTALKSAGVLALTAVAVGGWWVMMIAAKHGPEFWVTWLGFDQMAAADKVGGHRGGVEPTVTAFFRLIDLMGVLFVPALYGAWCVVRGLLWQRETSQRFPLQFLAAWLLCGFAIWGVRLHVPSEFVGVWDLFVMLPLVGCAALTIEQIVVRRLRPVLAAWLVCLAVVLPQWAVAVHPTSSTGFFHDVWGSGIFIVGCFSAFAILSVWLLINARRYDTYQQVCLVGLLITLGLANTVHGLQGMWLAEDDRRSTYSLTEFHASLLRLEDVGAQILITDAAAPPDVEFVIRKARPDLSLETMQNWNDGIARAAEIVGRTKRAVLIVDWRSLNARRSIPPEYHLNITPRFTPTLFRGRRLTSFLLSE